ncbi:large tegument protein UL36 domain family protein [Histoplasma capsulatum var. duboisii H88]|uniref:Large tegument protein UL36 domain family protein n=3 Tax=Ajellomyces capsulatus TaxID=5037 RepID=A0A8A1LZ62_AJEC8|nr:large tegument protein UL36 domain family protein [Histoplasma capsulatum var. duboisii H88]
MMGTAKAKKDDSHKHGNSQPSASIPAADGNPTIRSTSPPQPASLRLPPIDQSRAQTPGRHLPPIFPHLAPMSQPRQLTQPPLGDSSAYKPFDTFPMPRPTASHTRTLQSIYLREIEFHCICAARRFWEAHRPQPMLKLVVPNAARPSRPFGSDIPWRGINVLTDPAFRDLQKPIREIFRTVDQATRNDDGLGLREYLSLIADLDWDRVRQQQHQQHLLQQGQQQQSPSRLQQPSQQQLTPSGQPGIPTVITAPRPLCPPPNSNVVDTARKAYSPQFTTIQLLDDLYTWCETVVDAVLKVNVWDGDKEPVELSFAELEGVVSSAKGLVLSLNGTMEHRAVGEVWAKWLQSRYP